MTYCNNCGHTDTFVLLVQFALAVPGPDAPAEDQSQSGGGSSSTPDEYPSPSSGDCSLAVQCPACDSTDVGVTAAELLARQASSTTS